MIEQDYLHPEPELLSATETAGSILASARVGWGLSVEDVAVNLNLSTDTIKALEQDEYEKLPGSTFVKGYVRAYANLLRLNPDEVISILQLKPEVISEIPATYSRLKLKGVTSTRKPKKKGNKVLKFIITILLIAGLASVGLEQWSRVDTRELARVFKLPVAEESNGGDSVFNFSSDDSTTESKKPDSDGIKSALIRIE